MILALKILAGFLMGAIPFAKLAMLGTGIDISKTGSKNPGFNNVLRVTKNWWRAGVALIGDISKGYVALLLLGPGEISASALWFIAIAAVVFLEPWITLVCLPLYLILRFFGRKVHWRQEGAIASLATMFVISAVVLGLIGTQPGLLAYLMFTIILVRHTPNLREIMASRHE